MESEGAIARLETVVATNRLTIAVIFPLVGAVLLLASARGWLPPLLAFNPVLILGGVLVMRLPVAATIAPLITRRFGAGLLLVAAYTYLIESVGIATGWPYGEFVYGVALGPMIGGVPIGLPAFFMPLVIDAYLLCGLALGSAWTRTWIRVPATVVAVIAIDLVLDPAAVSLGLWTFADGGPYYGVPLSNFAGWLLSATVAVTVVDVTINRRALRDRLESCSFALDDLVSFVLLWSVIAAASGAWIPVAIAGGFAVILARLDRLDLHVGGSPEPVAK
ncbi:MAG: bisanhydrobacterioruberin hydratase [Salinirussus sp.]